GTDSRHGARREFLKHPAQLGVDEASVPFPALMLYDFGAVQNDRPALLTQQRHKIIDAIAGIHLGRLRQTVGVGIQLAQAQVAVFAAIETPEESARDRLGPGPMSRQPVLHDGGLALSAGSDKRRQAYRSAAQSVVERRQFRFPSKKAVRLRGAMMDRRRPKHIRGFRARFVITISTLSFVSV